MATESTAIATSILILGGARSGKSGYAERRALALSARPVYIATAQAGDAEMAARIARHRGERSGQWRTVESPRALADMLRREDADDAVMLVDCLTLWLSNHLLADSDLDALRVELVATLGALRGTVLLVANEVGQGIVPDNALARRFRDEAGWLNQAVAAIADEVWFVTAGLPQQLK